MERCGVVAIDWSHSIQALQEGDILHSVALHLVTARVLGGLAATEDELAVSGACSVQAAGLPSLDLDRRLGDAWPCGEGEAPTCAQH